MQWLFCHELFKLRIVMNRKINIGTRGSALALWQANSIRSDLLSIFPDISFELVIIKTKGDKILDVPLAKVGGKGLFVKEIEEALLSGDIDMAVHSMKDMPALIPPGLCIGSVPIRENPKDVLISRNGLKLSDLKSGATIGTSSLRRSAQLLHAKSDLNIVSLRGNLDTRLKKLENENLEAIILAAAGVKRLGYESRITEYIEEEIMLPAVGQGALCIEIRENDSDIKKLVSEIDHIPTKIAVTCERAFLSRLEGSCQVPVAAHGIMENTRLTLTGLVASLDGTTIIRDMISGNNTSADSIGIELAETLLSRGAGKILESLKLS